MNITCGQCGKRYKMKAEQTKKAFKTRCKRCSNVIIVRPEDHLDASEAAEAAAEGGFSVETSQPAPATQEARVQQTGQQTAVSSWYAAINGVQSGPFSIDQLEAYIQSGGLDATGYVWRDGMPNWAPLGEVSELSALLSKYATSIAGQAIEQIQAQPSFAEAVARTEHNPEQSHAQPAVSLGVEMGHDRQLLQQAAQMARSEESDLMSSVSYGSSGQRAPQHSISSNREEPKASGPLESDLGQLTNQRNENSVLFSLESIDAAGALHIQNAIPQKRSAEPVRHTGGVSNTGGTEGSGLIDLSALSNLTSAPGTDSHVPISISTGVKGRRGSLARSTTDPKSLIVAVLAVSLAGVLGLVGYQQYYRQGDVTTPSQGFSQPVNTSTSGTTLTVTPVVANPVTGSTTGGASTSQSSQAVSPPETPANPQSEEQIRAKRSAMTASPREKSRSTSKRSASKQSAQKTRSSSSSPSSSSKPVSTKTSTRAQSKQAPRPSSGQSKSGGDASSLLRSLRGDKKSSSSSSLDLTPTSSGKSGPQKPPKSAITSAMQKVNVARCISREPSLKGRGTIKVKIVAVSSGAIKSASVENEPYKSSAVGACIERQVKAQRFPSFTDPDIRFTFPFKN